MSQHKYIKLIIGGREVHISDPKELPISINYALEDPQNFQTKKSSEALGIEVPATLMNDAAANGFRNPDILDLTEGSAFRSNQPFLIDENGIEIMKGKAFLKEGTHTDRPMSYLYDLHGDNSDWKIDLEESTLYDFLKHIRFQFNKQVMVDSWAFDGQSENLPFVFAPVKYRGPFGGYKIVDSKSVPDNDNVEVQYLRPSISKYWIIYWAFRSVGYRLQSNFMDLPYFRRQVMPWTWGNFLNSEGTRYDIHRFRAKSEGGPFNVNNRDTDGYELWDLNISNDSTAGMFDNNNSYEWNSTLKRAEWTYDNPDYGPLEANLSLLVNYSAYAGNNCDIGLQVRWYKNGTLMQTDQVVDISAAAIQLVALRAADSVTSFFKTNVEFGDVIHAETWVYMSSSKINSGVWIEATVDQLQIDYFRVPIGGMIDFQNYTGFKKYKFLDFLRGVIDEFNLSINTDPVNKVVVIEPTHGYYTGSDIQDNQPGYFLSDFEDWGDKIDLSKKSVIQNYSEYNRELTFRYKPDNNDGILKVIQDRNITTVAAGKYVFPERFKTGKTDIENRFFSATMHYEANNFKDITGISPQLVCLVPENISNTSNSEASNTFVPKSCYYKGVVTGAGGWKFDGEALTSLPFMFAVNYKDGGENDPVLSYSDERIKKGDGFVVGVGLLRRFYWQRLAIMRNGQFYSTWIRLRNKEVSNIFHREMKAFFGHRWELVQIKGYRPLVEQSTNCFLRKWSPVTQQDKDNTFPSSENVLSGEQENSFDFKYSPLLGLISDIPST